MPKTRETEYRDRTGVEEEAEDRDEQVEDKVEDEDKDKEKTEFSSDDRDSSFRAANQHIVKFTDELRGVNEAGGAQLRPPEEPGGVRHERKEGDGGGCV